MTRVVQAAGGVILKRSRKGAIKILLVHRPKYDDWSFPKGRADKGEAPEETAVREVLEETGLNCRIVAPIGATRHRINSGVKEVHWFVMRPLPDSPGFKKNKEIDAIQWVTRKKAKSVLDYENDKELLQATDLKGLSQTGTIYLVRHALARNREKWEAEDDLRPITKRGRKQAGAIAEILADREIERIVSSPSLRCVQSVEPLAEAVGTKVAVSDALAEGPDIDAAYALIDSLVGYNTVLCSHGDVIPAVINRLIWAGLTIDSRFYCSKGSIWEVQVENGRFMTGHYIPPAA